MTAQAELLLVAGLALLVLGGASPVCGGSGLGRTLGLSLLLLLLALDERVGRLDGAVLLTLLIGYVSWSVLHGGRAPRQVHEETPGPPEGLARNVGQLTVFAVGTSLPEIANWVIGALRRRGDLAAGNLVGRNISNVGAVMGTTAAVAPGRGARGTRRSPDRHADHGCGRAAASLAGLHRLRPAALGGTTVAGLLRGLLHLPAARSQQARRAPVVQHGTGRVRHPTDCRCPARPGRARRAGQAEDRRTLGDDTGRTLP